MTEFDVESMSDGEDDSDLEVIVLKIRLIVTSKFYE